MPYRRRYKKKKKIKTKTKKELHEEWLNRPLHTIPGTKEYSMFHNDGVVKYILSRNMLFRSSIKRY